MRNTKQAFLWIIKILEESHIKYRISGGLAARIYGSKRKLADIDIQILEEDINKVYKHVKNFIIYGPKQYKDKHWNLRLMTLEYKNQEIDIAAFEAKIFNQKTKKWVKMPGAFNNFVVKKVFGVDVFVEDIKSLIKYKEILAREVDIEDVRQLVIHQKKYESN